MLTVGAQLLQGADSVVPVPLHPWRRARRGFNQAEDLARHLRAPVRRVLWRVRATAPQTALDARARRRNLDGAFRLSPFVTSRRRQEWLEGRTVVLIDDVRTTGATLDACATLLKAVGVEEVRALTVAKADLRLIGRVRPSTETAA
jgi:ComF family protein